MSDQKFQEEYRKLNKAQKEAVDTIEGPVVVIAGPGTGKTQILTLRIANILKQTDVPASAILALTFTESAVGSMKKRLAEIIGSLAYKVNIYTFHGFANEIIKNYPENFPKIIGFGNIDEIEQVKILKEVIDKTPLKKLKPYGDNYFYLKSIIFTIQNLKKEDVDPSRFEKLIDAQQKEFNKAGRNRYHQKGRYKGQMKSQFAKLEKSIEKNYELLKIYKAYQKELQKRRLYDYEDMIMEVVRALEKDKELLLLLQEEYQYILADEHQDSNASQNRLLELISSFYDEPNLFVVGDEKQAIFRFQGASLQNFLYFKRKYKNAKVIELTQNYRSPQHILDASHSLISKTSDSEGVSRPKLISQIKLDKNTTPHIHLCAFRSPEEEFRFIAKDISKKIKSGIAPSSIAVLYRDNKESVPISKAFGEEGLDYSIESSEDIFRDEYVWKLVLLLRAVNDLSAEDNLAKVIFLDILGISTIDAVKIIRSAREKKTSIFEIISNKKNLKKLALEDASRVSNLYLKLKDFAVLGFNKNLVDFLEITIRESGLLKKILKDSPKSLVNLESFFDFAKVLSSGKKFPRLPDLLEYLDLIEEHDIKMKNRYAPKEVTGVRLMTAHHAKGMEFDYCYMVGLVDKKWGNRGERRHFNIPIEGMRADSRDPNDDERRLFYVGLTRAKKEATLTFSRESENKEIKLPSQFLEEIDKQYLKETESKKRSNKLKPKIKVKSKKENTLVFSKEYLNKLFLEQGLSVSAINNYLECPWKYFFENLVRLPKAPNKFQSYGTAVHMAINDMFHLRKNGSAVSKNKFLDSFGRHLGEQILTQYDFQSLTEKAEGSLPGFFDFFKNRITDKSTSEYSIVGISLSPKGKLGEVALRGRLDLLESMPDGSVLAVDFKTSKPKTRNEILGNTKTADASIWWQLLFYKILLENMSDEKFKMHRGEIIFTEPDEKGRYHQESFELKDAEVEDFSREIEKISRGILSLSFRNKFCDNKNCEYCKLATSLN